MTPGFLSRSSAAAVLLFLAGSLSLTPANAESVRNWTDTKGRTVSAAFVRQDPETVWIKRADGREVSIPKNTLSDTDQIYLASMPIGLSPAAGGSGGKAPSASATLPAGAGDFATVKVDPASFKPIEGGFKLDNITLNNAFQSDHLIVAATEKVKPAVALAYLDAGERLWSDLLKDIPSLGDGFGGGKYLMVLADGEEEAKIIDSWHSKHASASKRYLYHTDMTHGNFVGFSLEKEFAAEHKVAPLCRMYRTDTKGAENLKRLWPQRIHFICEDLLRQAQGGSQTLDNDDYNLVVFNLVFSFQREFSICGKIETEVHFGGSSSEVEGFKNGRNWAAPTKKLIKNGAKPDISAFLKTEGSEAAPRDLGMGFGLVQWLRKDPKTQPKIDKIFSTVVGQKKHLTPEQFSTALGFDTPDALNAAWLKYLESDAFQ